jgi:SagB-type dehydrogenase family enzyme
LGGRKTPVERQRIARKTMEKLLLPFLFLFLFASPVLPFICRSSEAGVTSQKSIKLPPVRKESPVSIEEALRERRSVRSFENVSLTIEDISQLCWAAQGISAREYRTAPSAGALYPLELYLVSRNVEGLKPGIYRYRPMHHELEPVRDGQFSSPLASAALEQPWVRQAPALIVISAVYERTTGKYKDRGIRYVHIEVGAVAENISLQAISSELGTVLVGAFDDKRVNSLMGFKPGEEALLIIAVGRKRSERS